MHSVPSSELTTQYMCIHNIHPECMMYTHSMGSSHKLLYQEQRPNQPFLGMTDIWSNDDHMEHAGKGRGTTLSC